VAVVARFECRVRSTEHRFDALRVTCARSSRADSSERSEAKASGGKSGKRRRSSVFDLFGDVLDLD
jgi:hypothetical protein